MKHKRLSAVINMGLLTAIDPKRDIRIGRVSKLITRSILELLVDDISLILSKTSEQFEKNKTKLLKEFKE